MKYTETYKITPHSDKQKQIMQAFLNPDLQEMWVSCGTKFGKTFGASSALGAGMWVRKNKLFRWIAPIYTQSKIGKRYLEKIMPEGGYTINNSEPQTITANRTSSFVQYWHAKNPESLEGEAVSGGNIFDEYAKMPEAVYESASTTITQTRAPMLGLSTPKGKNHFYLRCMNAKERMEWAIKKGKPITHVFITASTADNPFVPKQSIEDARQRLPARLFAQYYRAEFIDDSAVFLGFRDCVDDDEPLDVDGYGKQFWLTDDAHDKNVVVGADWGKLNDYTVFTAIDYQSKTKRLVGFQRFNGVSYVQAVRELYHFARRFKSCGLLNHDITGVGQGIDDMVAQVNLPVQGITFTNRSKSDMVNQLILAFQKKEISLPNWSEMVRELDAYEVVTSAIGNYRYSAPEGSGIHDDIVCSLMLAWSAALEYSGDFNIRFLEDLPEEKSKLTLNKWYSDLIEDESDSPFSNLTGTLKS